MKRRVILFLALLTLLPAFLVAALPVRSAVAAENCRTFPETGMTVCDPFLSYWEANGGLAQQGYPISNPIPEISTVDNKPYVVQYFERAVFEAHPENVGTPYVVLLSLLGREKFLAKYPSGPPSPTAATLGGECATFPETGKSACDAFLAYWREHGGLAQQGFPISEPFEERSAADGKTYTVQYFERAVFEYHPENAGTAYEVLLSLLGSERAKAKYPNGIPAGYVPPPAQPSPPPAQPSPTPQPSPPPAPPTSGQAQGQGFVLILHAVRNPQAASQYNKPRAGYKFVAVDISIRNTGSERVSINRLYATLKTTDNREYERVSGPPEPQLKLGYAQPGQTSRGWVTFEIPTSAALQSLTYDPTFGRGPATISLNR